MASSTAIVVAESKDDTTSLSGAAKDEGSYSALSTVPKPSSNGGIGVEEPNEGTPGKIGTYLSYLLLIVGMVASIVTQRYADEIYITDWTSDCPAGFDSACKGNGGVLRFSFALSILYALQLIGTTISAVFFDKFWLIKLTLFIGIVIGFFFTKPEVFDIYGYGWFARIAGFLYIMLQQLILLDWSMSWNDSWVARSQDEGEESGRKWLCGLILVSVTFFATAYTALGIMFWQFSGPECGDSNTILSLTLIFTLMATSFQLFIDGDFSVLTSSVMTLYATYQCYSAVTLNPIQSCNPTLSTSYQTLSSALGMTLTVLSITWATYTAVGKVGDAHTSATGGSERGYYAPGLKVVLQEVSVVFILASSYYAMVLTNWVTLQQSYQLSNPKTGTAAMWLQASGQWIALLMYMWALVAPKLFPDRDFGGVR